MIQIAVVSVALTCADGEGVSKRDDVAEVYRRYLWMMLDGLKPARDGVSPLPVDPLTTAQAHPLLGSNGVPSKLGKDFS